MDLDSLEKRNRDQFEELSKMTPNEFQAFYQENIETETNLELVDYGAVLTTQVLQWAKNTIAEQRDALATLNEVIKGYRDLAEDPITFETAIRLNTEYAKNAAEAKNAVDTIAQLKYQAKNMRFELTDLKKFKLDAMFHMRCMYAADDRSGAAFYGDADWLRHYDALREMVTNAE